MCIRDRFLQNDREILQLVGTRRGSWLDQVSQDLNPKSANKASPQQAVQNLRKQIVQIQQKARKLREKKQIDRAKQLEKRVAELRKQLAKIAPAANKPEKVEVDTEKVEQLVNRAFLRTLSRLPSDDELARSGQYITEASDTIDGVRDLMWALLNTKEFIVNH